MIPLKRSAGICCPLQNHARTVFQRRSLLAPLALTIVLLSTDIVASGQDSRNNELTGFKELSSKTGHANSPQKSIQDTLKAISNASLLADAQKTSRKAIDKVGFTQDFVVKRTERLIQTAEDAELKIVSNINKLDETEVGKIKAAYQRMLSKLQKPDISAGAVREYLPKMDSLLTSASFLKSFQEIPQLGQLTEKLSGLRLSYLEATNIEEEISGRIQHLLENYTGKIPLKQVERLKQLSQTAKAQIREFKNMIEDPAPRVERLIDLAVQQQGFEGFFAEHAELSKLFMSPSLSLRAKPDSSLQTVAELQKHLEEKFGKSAQSLLQKQQQSSQDAMSDYQSDILNRIKQIGNSSKESDINTESVKPMVKRLSFTTDIRSQRSNGLLPAFSELGINIGYRWSPRLIAGFGLSGRIGWGKGFSDLRVTAEGVGIRSFVDYRIKGGFYATGGFEAIYDPLPDQQSRTIVFSQWQKNGLIGLKKGFRIKNGFIKGASFKLMWNYLSYMQKGVVQPFDFRIGYDF